MEMPGRGLEPLWISPPDPKSGASANSATLANFTNRAQFIAARDSRNRRVPGLCLRGERYYADLWVDVGNGTKTSRRFSLPDSDNQPVQTLSAAREALEIKRHKRRENQLPLLTRERRHFARSWIWFGGLIALQLRCRMCMGSGHYWPT